MKLLVGLLILLGGCCGGSTTLEEGPPAYIQAPPLPTKFSSLPDNVAELMNACEEHKQAIIERRDLDSGMAVLAAMSINKQCSEQWNKALHDAWGFNSWETPERWNKCIIARTKKRKCLARSVRRKNKNPLKVCHRHEKRTNHWCLNRQVLQENQRGLLYLLQIP